MVTKVNEAAELDAADIFFFLEDGNRYLSDTSQTAVDRLDKL